MKSLYDLREYTVTKFLAMETFYLKKEFLLIAGFHSSFYKFITQALTKQTDTRHLNLKLSKDVKLATELMNYN
jgi:hypothetical protein